MFHQLKMECQWNPMNGLQNETFIRRVQLDITVKGAVDYGGCIIDNGVPDPTTTIRFRLPFGWIVRLELSSTISACKDMQEELGRSEVQWRNIGRVVNTMLSG
jgi:hypothetical protein